jgi:hypothetical protein
MRTTRLVRIVWSRCEHMFVMGIAEQPEALRRCGRCGQLKPVEASRGDGEPRTSGTTTAVRAEPTTSRSTTPATARYVENAVRRRTAAGQERTEYLIECFRNRPCVDCGEARSARARVRPPRRQVVHDLKRAPRPQLEERPRRDRQVRRRLCKLSSSPDRRSRRISPRGGSSTVEPRPSKAMMRVRFPSAALRPPLRPFGLNPSAPGSRWVCAPRPGPPRPRPQGRGAARGRTSCPARRPRSPSRR